MENREERRSLEQRFARAASGDAELARQLACLFVEEMERPLADIREAARSSDLLKLRRAAHNLKGCVAILGFDEVQSAALALELLGIHGTVAVDLDALLTDLESACARARRETRTYLVA